MDENYEHNHAKQCEACFDGTCTPEVHRYGPDPCVLASYRPGDRSDKRADESWTEYWNRVRRELHGDKCQCYVCLLDQDGSIEVEEL